MFQYIEINYCDTLGRIFTKGDNDYEKRNDTFKICIHRRCLDKFRATQLTRISQLTSRYMINRQRIFTVIGIKSTAAVQQSIHAVHQKSS